MPPERKAIPIDADLVEAMAGQGLSQIQIAQVLGINYKTFLNRKKQNKEFCEMLDWGRAKGLEKVIGTLFNSAIGGNIVAIKYYLSNRDPGRWHLL